MGGENFEKCLSEVAKMYLKLSTMVEENFENWVTEVAKMYIKLSTMVGENFENCLSEVAKMYLNYPPWLEKILKTTKLKWLKFT